MMIPYQDLSRWNESELSEIEAAVSRVIKSGRFILGSELIQFEKEFASFLEMKYVIGVASGTDAISLSLRACGIMEGDEVITSALTAYPTITGIERTGAIPVIIDCDKDTGLLDSEKLSEAISERTKAVIPVHLWGNSCDMDRITSLSRQKGLILIEDCAQAAGTEYKGHKAGFWSDCAAYSFYPTKNLGAVGDAGAIVTNNYDIYKRIQQLRNYGQIEKNRFLISGFNSRLDEIQASILRIRLKYLGQKLAKRQLIADKYRSELPEEIMPVLITGSQSSNHIFPVFVKNKHELKEYLTSYGIVTLEHYPLAVSQQPGFAGKIIAECVNAESLSGRELSLPVNEFLQIEDQELIIKLIKGWLE